MSRFILGNCIDVMRGFPDRAVDLIVTDPPYLVGFKDRQGRQIAGDVTDEWLQPATQEMYRVLKKDALMVSFYGWNRVDRFMAAWKAAGFYAVGQLVFTKTYASNRRNAKDRRGFVDRPAERRGIHRRKKHEKRHTQRADTPPRRPDAKGYGLAALRGYDANRA